MKKLIKVMLWLLIGSLTVIAAGCGYTTRSMISDKFKTIYVVPFSNKVDITNESDAQNKYKLNRPLLETDVTKAVIDKFTFDGNLKPASEANADLVLRGEVTQFRKEPLTYDNNDEVTEYRIDIVLNIRLLDHKDNDKVVWEEAGFTGDTNYYVTGPLAKPETTATDEAIKDIARRVVERTVEDW